MTYSNTIPLPTDAETGNPDPLYQAWLLLKEARAVAFDAREPHAWRTTSLALIRRAHAAAVEHAMHEEGPGSPVAWLASRGGVTGGLLRAQVAEHASLLEALATLEHDIDRTGTPPLSLVVDVSERVVELEIAVARHQNRLGSLLTRHGMAAVGGRPAIDDGVAARRS